jgi:Domain of unknown function (DUF2760)
MGRVSAAFRIFFRTLSDAGTAEKVEQLLAGKEPAPSQPASLPAPGIAPTVPALPVQNPALTLLSALQREARLVDFLKEDLSGHPDALIGAAAREVHRDAGKLLDRLFGIQPIRNEPEDAPVSIPEDVDTGRLRLTGAISGGGARQGFLRHHGWEASRCDLPTFTGSASAANIIAPAEIEAV